MKSKIQLVIVLVVLIGLVGMVNVALAQGGLVPCGRDLNGNGKIDPPTYDSAGNQTARGEECKLTDLFPLLYAFINFFLGLAAMVAFFFIFWAAWGFMNAGGNEEQITEAKETLKHAIIGFFLVVVAFVLVQAVTSILTDYHLNFDRKDEKSIIRFLPQ